MSILLLKVFHMKEQVERGDADTEHKARCHAKWQILVEQRTDMATCFDELMAEIQTGVRRFKVYRQMKMYNDAALNPVLYAPSAEK
jgi:ribosome-associated translation inhibitor RaiA